MSTPIKLNSVAFGDQERYDTAPIIILHGLFGSARNWQSFAQNLSKQFKVFTLDLRNHGNSPHCAEMNYPLMARDVVQFLDDEQIATARVIGHSMGGKTAMTLAQEFPHRIAHLVIVDIAPIAYEHNYDELLGKLDSLDLTQITRRADANKLLGEALDDDELRLFLLQNLLVKPGEVTRWRINLDAIRENINHLVQFTPTTRGSNFNQPVDLIKGAESSYVTEAYYPQIRALFPTVRIHSIENAGHWPHAQNPSAFLATINSIFGG